MLLHYSEREIALNPSEAVIEKCHGSLHAVHIRVPGSEEDYICISPTEAVELFAKVCNSMPENTVRRAIDTWTQRNC